MSIFCIEDLFDYLAKIWEAQTLYVQVLCCTIALNILDAYNSALILWRDQNLITAINSFLHACEKSSINDQNILLNQILFSD